MNLNLMGKLFLFPILIMVSADANSAQVSQTGVTSTSASTMNTSNTASTSGVGSSIFPNKWALVLALDSEAAKQVDYAETANPGVGGATKMLFYKKEESDAASDTNSPHCIQNVFDLSCYNRRSSEDIPRFPIDAYKLYITIVDTSGTSNVDSWKPEQENDWSGIVISILRPAHSPRETFNSLNGWDPTKLLVGGPLELYRKLFGSSSKTTHFKASDNGNSSIIKINWTQLLKNGDVLYDQDFDETIGGQAVMPWTIDVNFPNLNANQFSYFKLDPVNRGITFDTSCMQENDGIVNLAGVTNTTSSKAFLKHITLAVDERHEEYMDAMENSSDVIDNSNVTLNGAEILKEYQAELDYSNGRNVNRSDLLANKGIRDVQATQDEVEPRIPVQQKYYLVVAFYSSQSGSDDMHDWIPVTLSDAGLQSFQLVGKNKYSAALPPDYTFADIALDQAGMLTEDPASTLVLNATFKVNTNKFLDQDPEASTIASSATNTAATEAITYYVRPQFDIVPYGIGTFTTGIWLPIGLFGLHKNDAGSVSFDAEPVSLAYGLKKYLGEDYIGGSVYVSLGNQNVESLFSGSGTPFTFISYGVLFDLDSYIYVGAAIENNLSVPENTSGAGIRGAAVLGISSALLDLLKGN